MSFGGLEHMMYTCAFAPVLLIIVAVCFSPVGVLYQTMFTSYSQLVCWFCIAPLERHNGIFAPDWFSPSVLVQKTCSVLWNRERKEHNALRRGAEVIVCRLTCVIHKWTMHSISLWATQIVVCCTVENAQRIATGC